MGGFYYYMEEEALFRRVIALPGSYPKAVFIDYMPLVDGSIYMEYIGSDNEVLSIATVKSLGL